jgi:NADH-quinone oxidoreductase subunit C
MSNEENEPEEKPAVSASEQPAPEKPAEKPPEAQAAKPAVAAAAKPPEPPPAPPPVAGVFGKFLKEKGVESTPLPLSAGTETMELKGVDLPAAIKFLRKSPETKLDFLVAVSGVDSPDTFDSVYHLWSYSKTDEVVLKVRVPKTAVPADKLPEVPSISPEWPAADWHERETYDLVGIRYLGHRYLRRILNPWDWEGHPLRRDYKQPVDALNDKHPDSFR